MHVVPLDVPSLGNRTHLVHDGAHALVVDPPRDLAPVEQAAEAARVEITAVADTHLHNDYVSGALGLARRHGADYLLSADEAVEFERVGVRDGDVVPVGRLHVSVLATPGHTRHHQSFLVRDHGPSGGPGAVFSGGSLLHGTVGRTDLSGVASTHELARQQWASARLLGALDPATTLHPTHGFGSFCAGSTPEGIEGEVTIGEQRQINAALTTDRERFVAELVGRPLAVTHRWAGLFGFVPDLMPVAGPVPGDSRVWVAGGYSGHGNVLGFACGRLVADAVAGDEPDELLAAFDPARLLVASP